MRVRTRSACVVLAWGILLLLVAVGSKGSPRPAQANIRIASNTTSITSITHTPTSNPAGHLTSHAQTDTDPRPDPGTYVVQPGDTLSGIAATLGTRGGWPTLYAANRKVIGPDPDAIQAGAVLTIPHPAPSASASPAPRSGRPSPAPSTSTSPAPSRSPAPAPPPASARPAAPASAKAPAKAPATGGLPRWLEIVLLAAGVLIGTAFLTEPVLAVARRRRRRADPTGGPTVGPTVGPAARPPAKDPRILLADYDRLVVTSSGPDGTVCVLRPPGADPEVILRAARLVLAQDRYEQLAGHLGVAAHGRRE